MSKVTSLANFQIERRLAIGGMAEVFLAHKEGAEGTSKTLVIKRILPDFGESRRFRSMFIEEAQLATRLNHPNLVQVYELIDAGDEGHLLAMEYVDGPDLGELVRAARKQGTRIGPYISAWICAEAAKGLHYAHEKKDERGRPLEIVHRDVSPQNVLISNDGVVKITDFGIASARLVEEEDGVIKGKYGYMSPEQARGQKVDRRSDLYSLGVILWECLTGRALHGGLGGEALLDIVRSGIVEPPSLVVPDVPAELEAIVMKLLAKEPSERFETGREVAIAIGRALLQKQELVDSSVLEHRIGELGPGDRVSGPPSGEDGKTQAAAPAARSGAGRASRRPRAAREVRHVVLLGLRLEHEASRGEERRDARALDRLRRMLDEMAYKRGFTWRWLDRTSATAIAGLSARHARAPFEAAQLSQDTHEALAGYADEVSSGLSAAISMVRGIASGHRDTNGNLVSPVLQEPAPQLSALVLRHARAGTTLVAGGLQRLIRKDFLWGETLELEALDILEASRTMRVYELVRMLSREERRSQGGSELVGRDAERADLNTAFHRAQRGVQLSRAVVGEMGIGKSALVQSLIADIGEQAQVVRVECTPVNLDVPYSATGELVQSALQLTDEESKHSIEEKLMSLCQVTPGDPVAVSLGRLAELAAHESIAHGEEEELEVRRLYGLGVRRVLSALVERRPLVLLLESFQWADRQSLDLFAEVLATPVEMSTAGRLVDPSGEPLAEAPLLTLVVTRPEARMQRLLDGVVRVELSALTNEDQVRLIEQRLGVTRGVRAVCAELLVRAAGNPFFLIEMVDALLERGTLEIQEQTDETRGKHNVLVLKGHERLAVQSLPVTVEQLLSDRISELPERERYLVDLLAVSGGPLSLEAIDSIARFSSASALAQLCARGICEQRAHLFDFRHPLMRDAAYAVLERHKRRHTHQELGEYLATTALAHGAQAAVVARHFVRAGLQSRAARYFLEAAHTAKNANQVPLAVKLYERAAACLERPQTSTEREERLRALDGLEMLYRSTGQRQQRERVLAALARLAKSMRTPRAGTVALLRHARHDLDSSRLPRGIVRAKLAAELAREHQLPLLGIEAESLQSELLRESGDAQAALAACDRAWSACDPEQTSGVSPRTRAEVLTTRGVLLRRLGRVREAVDAYADAIAYAKHAGAKRIEARASNALAYAMFVQGRYEDAIALGVRSIQLDLATGGRFQVAKTLTNIGHSYARLGQHERAVAYIERAQQAHERYGDLDGLADLHLVSAEIALEYSSLAEVDRRLVEAERIIDDTANAYDRTHAAIARALWLWQTGEPRAAADLALEARREAEHQALVAFHYAALTVEAMARIDLGESHAGTLLATTTLGAASALQGCEYGLEIRLCCALTLHRARSPQAPAAWHEAHDYAAATLATIRDGRYARSFGTRPYIVALARQGEVDRARAPRVLESASAAPEELDSFWP